MKPKISLCAVALCLLSTPAITIQPSMAFPFFHNNNNQVGNVGYFPQNPYFGYTGDQLDTRENRLNMAVQKALSQGKLSQRSANHLLRSQQKLNNLEGRIRMQDGGSLSVLQRARLNADQTRLSTKLRAELIANKIFF